MQTEYFEACPIVKWTAHNWNLYFWTHPIPTFSCAIRFGIWIVANRLSLDRSLGELEWRPTATLRRITLLLTSSPNCLLSTRCQPEFPVQVGFHWASHSYFSSCYCHSRWMARPFSRLWDAISKPHLRRSWLVYTTVPRWWGWGQWGACWCDFCWVDQKRKEGDEALASLRAVSTVYRRTWAADMSTFNDRLSDLMRIRYQSLASLFDACRE